MKYWPIRVEHVTDRQVEESVRSVLENECASRCLDDSEDREEVIKAICSLFWSAADE